MTPPRAPRILALTGTLALCLSAGVATPALALTVPDAGAPGARAASADDQGREADDPDEHGDSRGGRGQDRRLKDVQLLAFNDFHGNLEPPAGSGGRVVVGHTLDAKGAVTDVTRDAGGAAYLAAHLAALRQGQQRSITLGVGDQIGASPLLSAAFHDEPTMEALRLMGLDAAAVGNHEFDEGYKELLRMAYGGCLSTATASDPTSCPAQRYPGAGYPLLAANVYYAGTRRTILPSSTVVSRDGVRVGIVGVVLKDTANIVTKAGVAGLEFGDEVEAINRATRDLKRQGVNTIVALVHQGGSVPKVPWVAPNGTTYQANATYDATCAAGTTDLLTGSPVLPIAQKADPAVDMIFTAHSHQAYQCTVPDPAGQPRPVTQALSFGRLITEVHLKYDPRTKDVRRDLTTTRQVVVTRDVTPDPQVSALIDRYKTLVKPIAGRVLGRITADVLKAQNAAGESALGDLVADAQLTDPSVTGGGKPVVAFMNPGGIRADLTYASSPNGEGDGVVTYEEAFTVQPFNNYLVSMDLTGAQLYTLLGQQFSGINATSPRVLQVSAGFTYSWRKTATGAEIVPGSVAIGGVPVVATQTYRVVANSFLSDGGDGFGAFAGGTNKVFGGLDIDGFAAYLAAHSPYAPLPPQRITLLP